MERGNDRRESASATGVSHTNVSQHLALMSDTLKTHMCAVKLGEILKQGTQSRIIVERFKSGDDIAQRLNELVQQSKVTAGSFMAIGAVKKAILGFFVGEGRYSTVSIEGPLEIVSCVGNVSLKDDHPFVHAHISLVDNKGKTYGGHLMPGCTVGATFEITMHAYDTINLVRKLDSTTSLYLLDT
jgi:hypothetical protein